MALKLNDTFSAINTQKTASNVRGNVQVRLGAGTSNDTTGAFTETQVGVVSIYVRSGSSSPAGAGSWMPLVTGVAVPAPLEFYFTDYMDLRVVLTALTTGAALPVQVVDGSAA